MENTVLETKSTDMKNLRDTSSTVAAAALGTTVILTGNPMAARILMNLIQQFYYLLFISIDYPINVQIILNTFAIRRQPFLP